MKEVYLVHIFLPETFSSAFSELLNRQRDQIKALMESRVLLSYSLDMDRKNVWAYFETENRDHLNEVIKSIPVFSHVHFKIHELAFHNVAPVSLPDLILN
jgi:hypothetical protein